MDNSKIEGSISIAMPGAKPIDVRMSEAEQRIAMLENAFRSNSHLSDAERVAKIEKFLTEKLGMPVELPAPKENPTSHAAPQSNG